MSQRGIEDKQTMAIKSCVYERLSFLNIQCCSARKLYRRHPLNSLSMRRGGKELFECFSCIPSGSVRRRNNNNSAEEESIPEWEKTTNRKKKIIIIKHVKLYAYNNLLISWVFGWSYVTRECFVFFQLRDDKKENQQV